MSDSAERFSQYFELLLADYSTLQEAAYKMRHDVYVKELGWETDQGTELEQDEFDEHAITCMLKHKSSGMIAGSMRLIFDCQSNNAKTLPLSQICHGRFFSNQINPVNVPLGKSAEISRIVVPTAFRRRHNEQQNPFSMSPDKRDYAGAERRSLPNIALGLCFSGIAVAKLCGIEQLFCLLEVDHYERFLKHGIKLIQVSEEVEHRGKRAAFNINVQSIEDDLPNDELGIYEFVYSQLEDVSYSLSELAPTEI